MNFNLTVNIHIPTSVLGKLLDETFLSFAAFKEKFSQLLEDISDGESDIYYFAYGNEKLYLDVWNWYTYEKYFRFVSVKA